MSTIRHDIFHECLFGLVQINSGRKVCHFIATQWNMHDIIFIAILLDLDVLSQNGQIRDVLINSHLKFCLIIITIINN